MTSIDPDTTPGIHPVLSYLITSSDPFTDMFSIDATTGEVKCSMSLVTWSGNTTYVLTVIASDGVYTTGPLNLTLSIVNITETPRIINLPSIQTVKEDSTLKANIFQVLLKL